MMKFAASIATIWLSLMVVLAMATAQASASADNRLVYATPSTYETLDPHVVLGPSDNAPRLNLYDSLLRWLDTPARLEPWLAEQHVISPDARVHTFSLRKGVRFHDGVELKASDVVYSMERILALQKGVFPLLADLVAPGSTRASGEYTVVFNLTRPSPVFLGLVPQIHIVNAALVKKHEVNNDWGQAWLATNDAGSGSYRLTSYDRATGFTAERFEAHWNTKWPAKPVTEIAFRTVPEPEIRSQGLIDGVFHAIDGYLPPEQVQRLKETKSVALNETDGMRVLYAAFNGGREPTSDANFRKAVVHAFDYEGFLASVAPGATRNSLPLPPAIWGAPKNGKGPAYDLEKARELIARMPAPPREVAIGAASGFPPAEKAATLLQGALTAIGMSVRLVIEPPAVLAERLRDERNTLDILFQVHAPSSVDPHAWIGEIFDCIRITARQPGWACNAEMDKLLKEALGTLDQEQRRKLYERAALLATEDAAGLFVYNVRWLGAVSRRVSGIRYSPVSEGRELRWASLD
jgi:ABC-type transport system substrate-binding protein